ncbi:G-protein coupled receptor 15-like isoform X2 [Syngnathoides biaculeatus]|uniref:G-protein coupled receptor 15-like isoform X2 n=1 Tax=Syngnathoides biaculeatus TaxID=300417 RepID=UPI002ADD65ED|nr:G-protein coupled receptor 15-like isoform X2 [Syngnathoides biaculeatus]
MPLILTRVTGKLEPIPDGLGQKADYTLKWSPVSRRADIDTITERESIPSCHQQTQFDRYLAVCHPFFYHRFISRSLVIGACAFCWIYTYSILTVQNMVPISKAAQINAFGVMTLQIIVLVKVLMTVKLYVIARNHLAREPPSAERDSKRESLRIIVFVVICFLALWCPSFINIIVRQLTRTGLRFRNEATNLFAIMARLNALVTPALYIWGSPALRGAVWRRVCPRPRVG